MSMINKEISDFRTYAFHENDFKFVSKEDILGKWSAFFFYPADFTFVCPTELEDLADKYEQFKAIGCEVYSVSTDTHFVHKAWHDASDRIKKINYPMLADPTHAISRDFQVLIESDGLAERGQVLAKPGSIHPHTKFVGQVYVLSKEEGGRHTPFFNNYRPQFYFRTTDVTGIITLPEGVEMCMPGDNVDMNVELITPIAIEEGLRFAIREGGRTVGSGVVIGINE